MYIYIDAPPARACARLLTEPSFRSFVCAVVAGQRKDGTSVPLTLSVSPCGEPGEYIAVLYRRTDVEARIRAESAEACARAAAQLQAKMNELLESELSRLKLLIFSGSPAARHAIHRDPTLVTAWTGEWTKPERTDVVPAVTYPCYAFFTDERGHTASCRWLYVGNTLGKEGVLAYGAHAFVKVLSEPFLRVGPHACSFGQASGHPLLASEEPVLYAGELEVDRTGNITRWSNQSGTYKAEDSKSYQTGLPLDKFWAVHTPTPSEADERLGDERLITVRNGVLLRRVLSLSDTELEQLRLQWDLRVTMLCENPEARACFESMQCSLNERVLAVSQYGYLIHVKELG